MNHRWEVTLDFTLIPGHFVYCGYRSYRYTTDAMNLLSLASHQLRHAADLVDKIEKLKTELSDVLHSGAGSVAKSRKPRKLSDAGRLAIAAAQKARWAKLKVKSKLKPIVRKAAKRTMSTAAKAKIAAAAKARWAKAKAAGKNAL